MATSKRDVELNLAVKTTGEDSISDVSDGLKGIAKSSDAAAPAVEKLAAELNSAQAATESFRQAEAAARADVNEQRRLLSEQGDALARLKIEYTGAARSTEEYRSKERALRASVLDSRGALRQKQAALEAARSATRGARSAEQSLAAQLRATSASYRDQAAAATAAAKQQAAAHRKMADGIGGIKNQLTQLRNIAGAAVGGSLLGGLARDLAQTADAYANLQARIRLVTGEGEAFDQAFKGVFEIAQRTNSAIEETGTLFARIAQAGKAIGVSNAEALALTETINQAVQVSGSSAESSSAAVTQLIQGLQSGVLRGEEFNSVMEQAPRLAQALADGMGVTTGELRKMSQAGQLTAETVIASLQGQSATLQAEFDQLPTTVGRSLQNLSTAWTQYVGEVDKANGVSETAAEAINALARNLDTLGALLFSAGKAAAAYQALRLARTFLGIGAAAGAATKQVTALAAAQTAANAAAGGAAAGASRFAAAVGSIKAIALIGVLTNLKEIGTWLGETAAKWTGWGKVIEDSEFRLRAAEAATRADAAEKAKLAQQTRLAAEAALGLNDESRRMVAEFESVRAKGGSVEDALKKVADALQLSNLDGIANAGATLDALAIKGSASAEQVRDAWGQALEGVDLGIFEAQARAAFDESEQGARRLQTALEAIAHESLRRAGVSVAELQTGFSAAANSAINDVDMLAQTLEQLKLRGDAASRALALSLSKATDAATTERAVQAVIERFEQLGKQGLLTGEHLATGLERARQKLDELQPGISNIDEAFRQLGLRGPAEMKRIAEASRQAWERIKNDGTVTLQQKQEAFSRYARAAIAANGGVISSELRIQAEMRGVQLEAEQTGGAIVNAMGGAEKSIEAVASRASKLGSELSELKSKAEGAADSNVTTYSTGGGGVGITAITELRRKAAANALTADDLRLAEAAHEAAKNNFNTFSQAAPGVVSLDGQRAVQATLTESERILREVQGLVKAQNRQPLQVDQSLLGQVQGRASGDEPRDAPRTSSSAAKTVNINIGGRRRQVEVGSDEDAENLVAVMRELESNAGRSFL